MLATESWRSYILCILIFGSLGLGAELYLLGHYEEPRQWIPLLLLVVGTIASVWVTARPTAVAVRVLRGLTGAYLPAGVLGVYFHLRSNIEFELELHPNSQGLELAMASLRGAFPSLAPGSIILLGLIGLLVCLDHPATRLLSRRRKQNTRG